MSDDQTPNATGLAAVSLFHGLSVSEIESVSGRCRWQRFVRDQQIVNAEDATEDVHFIVSGTVRAEVYSVSGRAVTFRDLGPGDIFGELSAIDHKPRSANVLALNDVTVASVSATQFWQLIQDYPAIAEATLQRLTSLVRSLSDRVVEFSTLAVRNRIHAELLRLARDHLQSDNSALIAPSPTHAEISARISTHREAVSRELSELARSGIVERRQSGLFISDIEQLTRLLEDLD
ncbi:MAG: cyclic nucleotide-binding domain-containing protein [Alphaproteobacteria bacterium]|nr:cyclic nucleotide-binding domain-containing protein [Alphaproteobacteria bacterium]